MILLGSAAGFNPDLRLDDIPDWRRVVFTDVYEYVSEVGDINGDGFTDIGFGGDIIFGRADVSGQVFSLANGSVDIDLSIGGEVYLGNVVVISAGDFNGDGLDDLLMGSSPYLSDVSGSRGGRVFYLRSPYF